MNLVGFIIRIYHDAQSPERQILQGVKLRKAKWIGHILQMNCLIKHIIEGKIEGKIKKCANVHNIIISLIKENSFSLIFAVQIPSEKSLRLDFKTYCIC